MFIHHYCHRHPSLVQCYRYCLSWGLGQGSVTPCSCATGSTSDSWSTSSTSSVSLVFFFQQECIVFFKTGTSKSHIVSLCCIHSCSSTSCYQVSGSLIYSAPPKSCSHLLLHNIYLSLLPCLNLYAMMCGILITNIAYVTLLSSISKTLILLDLECVVNCLHHGSATISLKGYLLARSRHSSVVWPFISSGTATTSNWQRSAEALFYA